MASALRSFSRRSLSPKWFCKTSSTSPSLVIHHIRESSLSVSSLLARSFHRQVFSQDRTKMSFAQPLGSGVLLCRHISSSSSSSKPEESCIDALGDVVPVEAMSTTIDGFSLSFDFFHLPKDCVHYVINVIYDLTGLNWWMSVLTSFLVNALMSPVYMRIQREIWDLKILLRSIQKVRRVMETCDPKSLAKHKKWKAECIHKFEECYLSFLPLILLELFITISFVNGISAMAKKIPGFANGGIFWFTDLSTPEPFYILPLVTGLTFWFTSKVSTVSLTKILSSTKELPWHCIFFIVVQAAYKYEPAVYLYLIPYKISINTLSNMCRLKQIEKLSKALGVTYVPVAASGQQRITARVISVMREFIEMVKKKDKK